MMDAERSPTLFDLGRQVMPIEVQIGTRKPRRSSARAWKLLVRLESAMRFDALSKAWEACVAARLDGTLDELAYTLLSRAWERRRDALRAALVAQQAKETAPKAAPKRKGKKR